jgi:type I site-specific restriction endonuclease
MLLTEGFDDPGIDCVIVLRPTRVRSLFSQMVGRGTRTAPGKKNLLLLDFLWLHERHNLLRPAHLVAESEDEARAITQGTRDGEEVDLERALVDARAARERKLRDELERQAQREERSGDALDFCLTLDAPHLIDWRDTLPWHPLPITEKQSATLERHGIDPLTVQSRGHACAIIEVIVTRAANQLASPRQVMQLRRFGHPNPEKVPFQAATTLLERKFHEERCARGSRRSRFGGRHRTPPLQARAGLAGRGATSCPGPSPSSTLSAEGSVRTLTA